MYCRSYKALRAFVCALCAAGLLAAAGCARYFEQRALIRYEKSLTPEQEARVKVRIKRMRAAIIEKNLEEMAQVIREMESPNEMYCDLNHDSRDYDLPDEYWQSSTSIHFAAALGFVEGAELLLRHGADINSQYANNMFTPLHSAASEGQFEMVKLLIAEGADIDRTSDMGFQPPQAAFEHNKIVEYLLDHGANPKFKTRWDRRTYLHYAAMIRSDHAFLTKLFVDRGVNPNARDRNGHTPLHYAAEYNVPEIVPILLESGANVGAKDDEGKTPAMIARDHEHDEVYALLIDHEKTPLHRAIDRNSFADAEEFVRRRWNKKCQIGPGKKSYLHYVVENGTADWVPFLVKHGCRLEAKDEERLTPLHRAALENRPQILRALIEAGANTDARVGRRSPHYAEGFSTFHLAVRKGRLECVWIMLEMGQSAEQPIKEDRITPLIIAILCNEPDVARLLLRYGADVNRTDDDGFAPLHHAPNAGMGKLLIDAGAEIEARGNNGKTPLHMAVQICEVELVNLLIASGADVNARTDGEYTPLHFACSLTLFGPFSLEAVRPLVEAGADVNARDEDGDTPLHWLAFGTALEQARLLVEAGADVTAKNEDGQTPLHNIRAGGGREKTADFVRLLLENGADCNARSNKGETPLHMAADQGDILRVRALLEAGADPGARNDDGETPIELARSMIKAAARIKKTSDKWERKTEKQVNDGKVFEDEMIGIMALSVFGDLSGEPVFEGDAGPYAEIVELLQNQMECASSKRDNESPAEVVKP